MLTLFKQSFQYMKTNHHQGLSLAFFILLISFQVRAYTVKGLIKSGKTSLPAIEVTISDNEGKQLARTVTDGNGLFIIDSIAAKKIVLNTAGKGYRPLMLEVITDGTDIDLGRLILEKETDLEGVTITARNLISTPEKTIVYANQTDKKRALTPFNMLTILSYKAPQLHVRESEKTLLLAGEEPQILVNGIKRPMSFISSIKPDAIEKIEFSTLPDIRFGKRYLNIITRRPQEGGWLMADFTGAVTTPRFFLSGVAEYTKGKNDFMLYYNGGYRHGHKEYIDEEEHYLGGHEDIILGVKGRPSSTTDRYHNINFNFTRMPSEKSMFVATGTLNIHDNCRKIIGTVTDIKGTYDRRNHRGYDFIRPNLSLYYYLKASETATVEVNAIGSYSRNKTHRNLSYSTGYDSQLSATSHTWYFSAEAIWKQELSFARLNTGIEVSCNDASNRYNIDGTASRQTLSSTRLNVYTSLGGKLFTIGYNLSAGITYYKVKKEMVSPGLTASVQKNFGDCFGLSYNFRYNPGLPPVSSYNDVMTPVNDLMYHIGGGHLKSQRNVNNQIQINFSKGKFYALLQGTIFNISHPLVTNYSFQDDPGKPLYGYFMEMPGNGQSFLSYGADCNVGISNLWNILSVRVSTGWGHNRLKAAETFTSCSWYLDLSASLYWKGWQLSFTAENLVPTWPIQGAQEKIRRWPYTSLTLYKRLGRWSLTASWNNLFSSCGGRYRTETLTSVAPRTTEFRMNDQGNLVEIGVSYQLITGKIMRKQRRSINLSGESDNGVQWDY